MSTTAPSTTAQDFLQRQTGVSADIPTTGIGAGKVRALFDAGVRSIRKEQIDYWVNSAFLAGQQWLYHNPQTNRVDMLPQDPDRVRLTVNEILPNSLTVIAKQLQRPLVFEVPPQSSDDAALEGSRIGEGVLDHTAREQSWELLREKQVWTSWKGGTALVCVDWDAKAGVTLGWDPETGESFGTGDVRLDVLSIVEAVTEPGARDIERGRWWIKATAMPPIEAQERYRLDKLPQADATVGLSPLQQRLLTDDKSGGAPQHLTLVLSYYERPTSQGKGQIAIVVGDKVVDSGPWPFPWQDHLNVACFRNVKVENRWTGDTVVTAAVPVQTALNAAYSNLIEHSKKAGTARLGVPDLSVDLIDEFTDDPGEVFTFNAQAGPPVYIKPPDMPPYLVELPDKLAEKIGEILHVTDVTRGEAPQNVNSGLGLSILAELADTPLGLMTKDQAEGWSHIASMVLGLYADKVTETRQARVAGAGNAPQVTPWSGKSLAGHTTAIVPPDAIVPKNKAAQYNVAIQLKQEFGDAIDFPTFLKIAEMPGRDSIIDRLNPDESKARAENADMFVGFVRTVDDFDDDAVHIAAHNEARKSERFHHLDDRLKEVFVGHLQAHETMAAEKAGQQAARMAVSPNLAGAPRANGAHSLAVVPPPPVSAALGGPPAAPGAGGAVPPVNAGPMPPPEDQAAAAQAAQPPPGGPQ